MNFVSFSSSHVEGEFSSEYNWTNKLKFKINNRLQRVRNFQQTKTKWTKDDEHRVGRIIITYRQFKVAHSNNNYILY